MNATLVLCVGNPFRKDDGLGFAVADRLEARHLPAIDVRRQSGEAAGLIDAWAGHRAVVLVDAIRTGAAPGTVHRVDVTATTHLPARWGLSSHEHGVVTAVELGRALSRLPGRLVVYGIEPGDLGDGCDLSNAVASAVDEVVDRVATEACQLAVSEVPV